MAVTILIVLFFCIWVVSFFTFSFVLFVHRVNKNLHSQKYTLVCRFIAGMYFIFLKKITMWMHPDLDTQVNMQQVKFDKKKSISAAHSKDRPVRVDQDWWLLGVRPGHFGYFTTALQNS
jgi:hypothetical protein